MDGGTDGRRDGRTEGRLSRFGGLLRAPTVLISTTEHANGVSHFSLSKTLQVGMGWNRLANTGVATAHIEMTKF